MSNHDAIVDDTVTVIDENDVITPAEAAQIAGVHLNTMYEWLQSGKIPGFQARKRGKRRISKRRLLEVLAGQSQNGG